MKITTVSAMRNSLKPQTNMRPRRRWMNLSVSEINET